jgi:hypothetical protein
MDLIDGCAPGVDLGTKYGDVVVGITDCEEWISLDSTPISPRVCVLDLDIERFLFSWILRTFCFLHSPQLLLWPSQRVLGVKWDKYPPHALEFLEGGILSCIPHRSFFSHIDCMRDIVDSPD